MELFGFTMQNCVKMLQMEYQTAQVLIRLLNEQSDQDLHCLFRPRCPSTDNLWHEQQTDEAAWKTFPAAHRSAVVSLLSPWVLGMLKL